MPDITSGSNDGFILNASTSGWAALRSATAGVSTQYARRSGVMAGTRHSARGGGQYLLTRGFFEFDTSGISEAPSSAILKIYGAVSTNSDVIVVRSEQSSTLVDADFDALYGASTPLGASDGNNAGTLAGVSGLAYSASHTSWTKSGYNEITLIAPAFADMASLSLFKVAVIDYDYDYLDAVIANNTNVGSGAYYADNAADPNPILSYVAGTAAVADNAVFFGSNF